MSKNDKIAKTSNYEKNRIEGQKITKTNGWFVSFIICAKLQFAV
jgi:hypothetical protein